MYLETENSQHFAGSIFNAIVGPRPIGWISTVSAAGQVNLAPFSYFTGVSPSPAMLMFVCNGARDRNEKDTLANLKETGEFVFNLAMWDLKELVNLSSATVPHGEDEFELAGLAKGKCMRVIPPRVEAAAASMECRVLQVIPILEDGKLSTIVIGKVLGIHIRDEFLNAAGGFDTLKAKPLLRMGGTMYATIGESTGVLGRPTAA